MKTEKYVYQQSNILQIGNLIDDLHGVRPLASVAAALLSEWQVSSFDADRY